ncbi:MAG TPA: HK97 family phage prohead protease, partial [Candidatus Tumulicola sp.]|nr:HK97 family phage prohead protease [Candidatus Tumulicola sp.]
MPPRNVPENRTIDVDVRDLHTQGRTVSGYAAVYDVESTDLGGFRERIAPGAFRTVLGADADVRCLLNHDPNIVLGRTRAGTLRLSDDARGLRFEVELPESRTDIREAIARGDVDGASFRFDVARDSWLGEVRTLEEIRTLHDVSIGTYPAYPAASIELRTREPAPASTPSPASGLIVRDRAPRFRRSGAERPTLAGEFRAAGFPGGHGERATIDFDRFFAVGRGSEQRAYGDNPGVTYS